MINWVLSKAGATVKERVSRQITVCVQNGKRASSIERCNGWLNGESSEDQNPMDGCGMKQDHEARTE
jgi:hypothetical protein